MILTKFVIKHKKLIPIEELSKCSHFKIDAKCNECGNIKNITYQSYNINIKKYNIYTCIKCSYIKNKLTKKEKYGDENFNNREKNNKTIKDKYGVENIFQLKEVKNKSKETKKDLYGDENFVNTDKTKQTNLNKYGVECIFQSEEIKNQIKETNLKNLSVEYPMQNEKVKNKSVETCLDNFGVKYSLQSPEVRERGKQTKKEKYNDSNYNNREKMIETKTGLSYDEYIGQLPDFKKYEREVLSITKKQPLYLLKNYDKRGIAGQTGAYHLDHMFTVIRGFKNNIPPYIIGNIVNLKMLTWEDNCSKHSKCSITKYELFIKYEK